MKHSQRFSKPSGCIGASIANIAFKQWRAHKTLASIMLIVISVGGNIAQEVHAQQFGPEGTIKFYVDAKSNFDPWTSNPTAEQKQFMRDHYYRMLTYAPYFDSRLSWYPNALEYRDAYAIYRSGTIWQEHPDWVLHDSNGEMLYIPYGCSGGSCTQYAADIGNPEFRSYWIERQKFRMEAGYLGIWIDDVNLSTIKVGNGNGSSVTPIDPRTGMEMTLADWRRYFAEFMEEIRAAFPSSEIAHNVHWWSSTSDPYVAREMLAADYINLERGISDSGIRGGSGKYGFESFLALVDWLHVRGKHIILEDNDDSGIQERDYELAFYLLINDGIGDMISADGDRDRMNPDNFWSGYRTDLGFATSDHYRWNDLFRRDFECGMVLVNQPDMPTIIAQLPDVLTDLNGRTVTSVTMASSNGQVLRKLCDSDVRPNPPTDLRIEQ